MFAKFRNRRNRTVVMVDLDQLDLDIARVLHAGDQAMQLHFDRMQSALNASRTI
jgi:hypothetical protein